MGGQNLIVFIIVSAAAVFLLRGFIRTLRSFLSTAKGESSGCGGACPGCGCGGASRSSTPAAKPQTVIKLTDIRTVDALRKER
jgi:hypothetical protein